MEDSRNKVNRERRECVGVAHSEIVTASVESAQDERFGKGGHQRTPSGTNPRPTGEEKLGNVPLVGHPDDLGILGMPRRVRGVNETIEGEQRNNLSDQSDCMHPHGVDAGRSKRSGGKARVRARRAF